MRLVFFDVSEKEKMGSYSDFFGAVNCAKSASLAFWPCDDMISLTLRALFGILGGVLLLCLSLVLSESIGIVGLCPRSRTCRGCWEPDGKPGSLPRGAGFVGRLCCGPILTGGTVDGR